MTPKIKTPKIREISHSNGGPNQGTNRDSASWYTFLSVFLSLFLRFCCFGGTEVLWSVTGLGKPKLQRYPLRSGSKLKEEKPPAVAELSNPSVSLTKRCKLLIYSHFFVLFGNGFFIIGLDCGLFCNL